MVAGAFIWNDCSFPLIYHWRCRQRIYSSPTPSPCRIPTQMGDSAIEQRLASAYNEERSAVRPVSCIRLSFGLDIADVRHYNSFYMTINFKRQAYSVKRIEKRNSSMRRLFAIRYSLKASTRGFTLIELVAVMGIIIIVTSVTLANNSRFGGTVLLQNLAYDMALSIRQAQVYGIAVRGYSANNFTAGYGMHFSTSEAGGSTRYELFADAINSNGLFDDVAENVSPSPYAIGRGYYISGLSVLEVGAPTETPVTTIDILFKRPEPDACISMGGVSAINGNGKCVGGKERARITVTSPRGESKSILVEATGQISVEQQ